jgi:hypothetical protein
MRVGRKHGGRHQISLADAAVVEPGGAGFNGVNLRSGDASQSCQVSQPWISRLVARYHAEGEAAFQPRSRRPHTSPTTLTTSASAEPTPAPAHESWPTTMSPSRPSAHPSIAVVSIHESVT